MAGGTSALKGVRRAAVIVVIAAAAVSAVLGIVLLLTGGWGELQGRILGTTATITAFSAVALCHLAQADRPLRALGYAGIAASVGALIPILWLIWANWGSEGWDLVGTLTKWFFALLVVALSLAQANLLLLLAARRHPAIRTILVVVLAAIAIVAVMILIPILSDGRIPASDGEWYWRLFGVAAIVDGAATIVLPVLGLVLKEAPTGLVALTLHVPAELVGRLDARAAAEGTTRRAAAEAALGRALAAELRPPAP